VYVPLSRISVSTTSREINQKVRAEYCASLKDSNWKYAYASRFVVLAEGLCMFRFGARRCQAICPLETNFGKMAFQELNAH
jgi:hypothetical protein